VAGLPPGRPGASTLTESDWANLLQSIEDKECTPFIGAGACADSIPPAAKLAERWANEFDYPLTDWTNLARVAQFLAVDQYRNFPKKLLRKLVEEVDPPDFTDPSEPHGVLADLALPIYITTNYDDFMFSALQSRRVSPRRQLCRWNKAVSGLSRRADGRFAPTPENPLVYHLHGHYLSPESIVITEDDYLQFLLALSEDGNAKLLVPKVREALGSTSLLFVGYSLSDWNFRVLFRGLVESLGGTLGNISIAVQLEPELRDDSKEGRARALAFISNYLQGIQQMSVRVYWGDVRDFGNDLRARLNGGGGNGH
jgi:hypothetical protein